MRWPLFFPPDCPPAASCPAAGQVYRFIAGIEPEPEDFRPHREIYPDRDFGPALCKSCGLSVFTRIEDLESLRRRVPAYRGRRAARGALAPEMGLTLPTPSQGGSSHVTWWVPLGISPWKSFRTLPPAKGGAA